MRVTCPKCGDVREAMNSFVCECGWKRTFAASNPKPLPRKSIEEQGREAWLAIHAYDQAGEWDAWECELWYYSVWYHTIPRYCECKAHWREIEDRMPPVFLSRDGFKQWAIDAHNQVNAMLGKPQWVLP